MRLITGSFWSYSILAMIKQFTLILFIVAALVVSAFRYNEPTQAMPVNSFGGPFLPLAQALFASPDKIEADTVASPQILMLNYPAYDSTYAQKARDFIATYWPKANFQSLWSGELPALSKSLEGKDVVMIPYPSNGDPGVLESMGLLLKDYIRDGGRVVVTGTHAFPVLQHLGLFDLDYGYFCSDQTLIHQSENHPILDGTGAGEQLQNFAYPLDISDPDFSTLVEVKGYPVVGTKSIGLGEVYYLGMEYYFDEPYSTRILANTIRHIMRPVPVPALASAEKPVAQSREAAAELAGKKRPLNLDIHKIKVYPNPYVTKAQLDIELTTAAQVSIRMTDETGRIVEVLQARRKLDPGLHQYILPDVAPGIYFLHYHLNESNTVRKVVKVAAP